jgi:hypothetical protein
MYMMMTEKVTGNMKTFEECMEQYFEHIKASYAGFWTRARTSQVCEVREKMIYEFNQALRTEKGSKFIKVIQGNSVHSFICIKEHGAFKVGDILKAASWHAPAKNFKRGNILEGSLERITWTGAS